MRLFDYIFKSREERGQEARVQNAIRRADDVIERTERMLEKMEKDDEDWKRILG